MSAPRRPQRLELSVNEKIEKTMNHLQSVSPVDGRYAAKTRELGDYFSEYALMKYRVLVEIKYFTALSQLEDPSFPSLSQDDVRRMNSWIDGFGLEEATRVKEIEKTTNHDVKAVEYWIKEQMEGSTLEQWQEFVHFGLTSQDVNNTAYPLMMRDAVRQVILPAMQEVIAVLEEKAALWENHPMLARTHGQPATPTRMGKEIDVFVYRLKKQSDALEKIPISGKFGGATGNFNAHKAAYPDIDWIGFADRFLKEDLGILRQSKTTQIENYDDLAALFHAFCRWNTILTDLSRDIWQYISMEYFKQKVVEGEVGSSAMPHKVNPIDFENAEGNLLLANAILAFMAEKLPVSRLQRDLSDSTVLRNLGVPLAHMLIALRSLKKGLGKITLNQNALDEDLATHWAVVAEALQNILRREGYPHPYETLKKLTRTGEAVTENTITEFIDRLDVPEEIKSEMKRITPFNYTGY